MFTKQVCLTSCYHDVLISQDEMFMTQFEGRKRWTKRTASLPTFSKVQVQEVQGFQFQSSPRNRSPAFLYSSFMNSWHASIRRMVRHRHIPLMILWFISTVYKTNKIAKGCLNYGQLRPQRHRYTRYTEANWCLHTNFQFIIQNIWLKKFCRNWKADTAEGTPVRPSKLDWGVFGRNMTPKCWSTELVAKLWGAVNKDTFCRWWIKSQVLPVEISQNRS